jgi:hypothetical protein
MKWKKDYRLAHAANKSQQQQQQQAVTSLPAVTQQQQQMLGILPPLAHAHHYM